MYVNVGAMGRLDKAPIPTKKGLKDIFRDNPGDVLLYETSMGRDHITYKSDELDIGVKYTVVGPNPYTSRKWYATVEKLPNGTIRVS